MTQEPAMRMGKGRPHESSPSQQVRVLHLMLMLDLAKAENMVAETPFLLAICCPTAASMQQLSMASMW